MKRNALLNKIRGLAGLAALAILFSGCGQAAGSIGTETIAERAEETVPTETADESRTVYEIYDDILESVSLCSPMTMNEEFIINYYGIQTQKLEEYVFSISEEATSAEAVVIMKVKQEADAESVSAALQVVIDEKRNEMENYLPEQFEIVDKSVVVTKGSYVYLVISDKEDEISRIIEEGI